MIKKSNSVVSSSIRNWRDKIHKRFGGLGDTWFFGLYHPCDYLKFWLKRGDKVIVWCGSDILSLPSWVAKRLKARHICENEVEARMLKSKGIQAEIRPLYYGEDMPVSFIPSKTPHAYISCHVGREREYGLRIIEKVARIIPEVTFHVYGVDSQDSANVLFHGHVPEAQFNEEIRKYHCGISLNAFAGFSEVVAKSILMGQYPISLIQYTHIDYAPNAEALIKHLRNLKHKTKPNLYREYWHKILWKPL